MKAACRMWGDFMRDNLLHMCRNMIFHHLMKNGIQFEKNKKTFEPPIEVADAFLNTGNHLSKMLLIVLCV